jgi:hypothetical protein
MYVKSYSVPDSTLGPVALRNETDVAWNYLKILDQYYSSTYVLTVHINMSTYWVVLVRTSTRALMSAPTCYVRKSQYGSMCGLKREITVLASSVLSLLSS